MLTIDELRDRYREAWLVARRVPSGINLGHASYWPEFNPNRWEVYHSEDARIKPAPPSADAVDRMVECMRWLRWLSEEERELLWLRASGMSWRSIAEEMGLNRKTPFARWSRAMSKIGIHLARGRIPE
ncbi:response regulator transcription factor [Endozoicomonas sp.]